MKLYHKIMYNYHWNMLMSLNSKQTELFRHHRIKMNEHEAKS